MGHKKYPVTEIQIIGRGYVKTAQQMLDVFNHRVHIFYDHKPNYFTAIIVFSIKTNSKLL